MSQSLDAAGLLAVAEAAVDDVEPIFRHGLGAGPAHYKAGTDFATEIDLEIETRLRRLLTQMTGIPVLGEEFGGLTTDCGKGSVWVVDPIDGTANYSTGNPMCGILLSLIIDKEPVVAVASFPLLDRRYAAAQGVALRTIGGTLMARDRNSGSSNGGDLDGHVGCSSHLDPEIFRCIRRRGLRPRITGSVGLDSAFVAQGVFDGAVNFSQHPWDNAAGALLVTAAGGKATDVDGQPWRCGSRGLVVGTSPVHAALMEAIERNRD